MKRSLYALAATLSLTIAAPASAAQYTFDFFGNDLFKPGVSVTGTGVFTTSDTATDVGGRTAFAITDIVGTVDGFAILQNKSFYGNYFTTGATFLDGVGVRLDTTSASNISFFSPSFGGGYRVNIFGGPIGKSALVTASSVAIPGAVPEPATWAMMIVGFGLAGGAIRQRRRHTTLAFA